MKRWIFAGIIMALFVSKGYCEVVVSGSPSFSSKEEFFLPGDDLIYIKAVLPEENKDNNLIDSVVFKLVSSKGGDIEEFTLAETGLATGVFELSQGINISPEIRMPGDGLLQVSTSQDTATLMDKNGMVLAILTTLPAIENFSVNVDPVQISGKPFGVEIIAQDIKGGILTNYTGAVDLEIRPVFSTGKEGAVAYTHKVNYFIGGRAKNFIVYPEAGKVKITVKDINNKHSESKEIFFMPAKLKVENGPLGTVGKEFSLKVTALNFNDEITRNYKGPAAIKPFKGDDAVGGDIMFNQGIAEAKAIYNKWGEMKFIVYDKIYADLRGKSGSIVFNAHRFKVEIAPPPKNRKKFYFEELFQGKVTVFDYQGNKILNYGGVAILEPVEDVDMPQRLYFGWQRSGEDTFYASGVTEKPFKIKAYDAPFPEIKGESEVISLMPAAIKLELAEKKDNKAVVRIKIEDGHGRVVSQDSSTVFTIHLIEGNSDDSAYLLGTKQVTAKNGVAKLTIMDEEDETVTVAPESEPYLEVVPLEVKFD